jgi:hypothetical protein
MLEQDLFLHEESEAALKKQQSLQTMVFEQGWDDTTVLLLGKLRDKILIYGRSCGDPDYQIILVLTHTDDLLLNHAKLQNLEQSGGKYQANHLNLFNSIIKQKPIDESQCNGIYYTNDFVSLVPWSWIQYLEYIIITVLKVCFALPSTFFSMYLLIGLQNLFLTVKIQPSRDVGHFYSTKSRIVITMARLFALLLAVGVLIFPVFIIAFMPMTGFWMSTLILGAILFFSILTSVLTDVKLQDLVIRTTT